MLSNFVIVCLHFYVACLAVQTLLYTFNLALSCGLQVTHLTSNKPQYVSKLLPLEVQLVPHAPKD